MAYLLCAGPARLLAAALRERTRREPAAFLVRIGGVLVVVGLRLRDAARVPPGRHRAGVNGNDPARRRAGPFLTG